MSQTILLATQNMHKLTEVRDILQPLGYRVIGACDLSFALCEVEETGSTFEENAMLKASAAFRQTGIPSIADDSGLCVDALNGAPGVYSARYAGEHGNDQKNNEKLLRELAHVPNEARTAKFVSAIACVLSETERFTVTGNCAGYIGTEPHGTNGFGYDPVFISDRGCFGLLSPSEKNAISHRHNSLMALVRELSARSERRDAP